MPTTEAFDDPAAVFATLLRRDFCLFLRKAFAWVNGGEAMLWNWHFDAIAHELDRVASGNNLRLLVTLPPRNGKSIAISIAWVAWMLGRDPRLNIACVSYSNELSAKMARDCLSIMQSSWYRAAFPKTVISAKRFATSDFETTAGGGRLATSVEGTLTGRGADIIILDDVIKPEDANSETRRHFVNTWYRRTLTSRLNDKGSGAIICVMQRLHEHDLAGMLLEAGGWDQLKLPAIATEPATIALTRGRVHHRATDDLLHPAREPLAVLEQQRTAMGSAIFAAQYQQDPVPAVGNVIKTEWLRSFGVLGSEPRAGRIVQSWDTASKENPHNDYSVCITARIIRQDIYILDVVRERMEMPKLLRRAIALAECWRPHALLIEDQASGQQLIQLLRGERSPCASSPIAWRPEGDKLSRMDGVSPLIEAGRLYLPEDAPWLAAFKSELLAFPNGRFDDQADALSQLLGWVRREQSYSSDVPGGATCITVHDDGSISAIGDDSAPIDPNNPYLDDPWG